MLRLLSLALLALGPTTPANVQTTTLDELRINRHAFAGRMVRVTGQLDQCWNTGCSLCPLEATPQNPLRPRCLAIDFDRFAGGEDNRGAGREMEAAFRYADITVTAKFDPACLDGPCLDRGSVLMDARVEQVTRRRRSRDGLGNAKESLLPAPTGVASVIEELVRPTGFQVPRYPVRIFTTASDPKALHSAVACVWPRASETPEWPTTYLGAIVARSTEDYYWCWRATNDRGRWRVVPN
jgi:hypothetical protein